MVRQVTVQHLGAQWSVRGRHHDGRRGQERGTRQDQAVARWSGPVLHRLGRFW